MLQIFSKYVFHIYATLGIGSELWILSAYICSLKYNNSWNAICAQRFLFAFPLCFENGLLAAILIVLLEETPLNNKQSIRDGV